MLAVILSHSINLSLESNAYLEVSSKECIFIDEMIELSS